MTGMDNSVSRHGHRQFTLQLIWLKKCCTSTVLQFFCYLMGLEMEKRQFVFVNIKSIEIYKKFHFISFPSPNFLLSKMRLLFVCWKLKIHFFYWIIQLENYRHAWVSVISWNIWQKITMWNYSRFIVDNRDFVQLTWKYTFIENKLNRKSQKL